MKFKLLLLIVLITAGLSLGPLFVRAQEAGGNSEEITELNKQISARKDKIKELEETIGKYKKNIEQKQTEAVSLRNQLGILDNHVARIQADIEMTREKIGQAELEIEALRLSIADKEMVIAKQKKIIVKLVQNLHADDQKNYLEILLTNDSFADFYSQVKYLENVYTDLGRSVKTLRLAKEELDAKKQQVENRKKTYEDLKKELEDKRQDLTEQTTEKQNLLTRTRFSEARFRTLMDSLKRQYQVVESEVRSFEDQVRRKLEAQNRVGDLGSGTFDWPVSGRYITATFHDPEYPFRRVFEHSGIDIRAAQGTPIRASSAGYVARAKRCSLSSCYSYLLLVHSGNLSTLYGHLSQISVAEDQFVGRGDLIGYTGGTPGTVGAGPFVTGPHLHFEVRQNGIPVNPMGYLGN